MCTAYELGKRGGSFPSRINAQAVDELLSISETSIIRPTLIGPVIMPDGNLQPMSWGFRREFAGKTKGSKTKRTIVNSREDKLSGATWRDSFSQRRCLIPAAAFYEWIVVEGKNTPLRFHRPGGQWTWIAGIWEDHPEHGLCYSMITTEPSASVERVHDRMPAVLSETQVDAFLDGQLNEFGPSAEHLAFSEIDNFLTRKKPIVSPGAEQGELF